MRRLRVRSATLVGVLLFASSSPAHAEQVVLADGGGPGNGWVVFKIRAREGEWTAGMATSTSSYGTSTMMLAYDANRRVIGGYGFGQGPVSEGVSIGARFGDENVEHELSYREDGWCEHNCAASLMIHGGQPGTPLGAPGTYYILLYMTGNQLDHRFKATGGSGMVEVLGLEHGGEAYMNHMEDFRGTANVHAAPWWARVGVQSSLYSNETPPAFVKPTAYAIVDGAVEIEIDHMMIGTFAGIGVGAQQVEVHGPNWSNRGCYRNGADLAGGPPSYAYCWFTNTRGANFAGPGTYRFEVDQKASADLQDTVGIWLADVRFPA